jgi:hypothetical protein
LWNLLIGITAAAAAARNSVSADNKNRKFDFCYQRLNSEIYALEMTKLHTHAKNQTTVCCYFRL